MPYSTYGPLSASDPIGRVTHGPRTSSDVPARLSGDENKCDHGNSFKMLAHECYIYSFNAHAVVTFRVCNCRGNLVVRFMESFNLPEYMAHLFRNSRRLIIYDVLEVMYIYTYIYI